MAKTSFIVRLHFEALLENLTDEEVGKLTLAVFRYQRTGELPQFADRALQMAFSMIKQQFAIDEEKYNTVCKKHIEAVKKRWENQKENSIKKNTNEYKCIQNNTKHTDNVNDNGNGNDNGNSSINTTDIIIKRETVKRKDKATVEEIREYCEERQNGIDAQCFFDRMEARGWVLKDGKPVKDWKACIRTWESFNAQKKKENSSINWSENERNDNVENLF